MPEVTLKNADGDEWTISLDEGESVGSTLLNRSGKYSGGTFSAKTPALALKFFHDRVASQKKEFGFFDPNEKASRKAAARPAKKAALPKLSPAAWKTWWSKLDADWQKVLLKSTKSKTADFKKIAALKEIDASEAGIKDLKPLEILTGLETINLYGNLFSNLQPLAKLGALKNLYIDNCAEVDGLRPLAKLNALEDLNVGYTSISDLKPLYRLKNLKILSLEGLSDQFDDWEGEVEKISRELPDCRIVTAE